MREQNDFAERMWFQFTHPGRGATCRAVSAPADLMFQFTHPGRGATTYYFLLPNDLYVSIHAPREGCDETE